MRIIQASKFAFIDNVNGIGSVPYNQEINYKGFEVVMKPDTFLDLAHKLTNPKEDSVEFLVEQLKAGNTIGTPFLIVDVPQEWKAGDLSEPAKIADHEGRHRVLALKKVFKSKEIPVHLFLRGVRKQAFTDEMYQALRQGMVKENSSRLIKGPLFKK